MPFPGKEMLEILLPTSDRSLAPRLRWRSNLSCCPAVPALPAGPILSIARRGWLN